MVGKILGNVSKKVKERFIGKEADFEKSQIDETADKVKSPVEELIEEVRDEQERNDESTEDNKESKTKDKKTIITVVKELPTQKVREIEHENGTIEYFVTVEEALSQILSS